MPNFSLRFSASVIMHLGKGLYRSLATVIAEAISNAWDADATEVRVEFNDDSLVIWDNGVGMDETDIQDKFLNIGYSKRDDMEMTGKRRKVIGRKGIGKLAYLSISDNITVITRKKGNKEEVMKISGKEIADRISKNPGVEEHKHKVARLKSVNDKRIKRSGTILVFNGIHSDITQENIRQTLAAHFLFPSAEKGGLSIYVDDEIIGMGDLKHLYEKIQFIWFLNQESRKNFSAIAKEAGVSTRNIERKSLVDGKFSEKFKAHGFIATVEKPSNLVITGYKKFKANIALFAGGRMRQAELLSDMSTAQFAESYMFGQIHVDSMDEDTDRFTSGRDSVIDTDPYYVEFLEDLRKVSGKVGADWKRFRNAVKKKRASHDNDIVMIKQKIKQLFNLWARANKLTANKKVVDKLTTIACENLRGYLGCLIAENMARALIQHHSIPLTKKEKEEIKDFIRQEDALKDKANIRFDVADSFFGPSDYLGLPSMAAVIDKWAGNSGARNSLRKDADAQAPIRNAVMHGRSLTSNAQKQGDIAWLTIVTKISALLEE